MNEPALRIANLSYTYRSSFLLRKKSGLNAISLEVVAGEAFGFLGHNGAGKTTCIKAILGLIKPSSGTISIFGDSSHETHARRRVGYIPEQPYFYDHLTVYETLEFFGILSGMRPRETAQRIAGILERVGIPDRGTSRLRTLSKGLLQRVALAQAILPRPDLLILDEPFSGLDPIGRKEFRDIFLEEKKRGVTLFMSSHVLSDVEFLCDRASILVRGELRGIFNLREISKITDGAYEVVLGNSKNIEGELALLTVPISTSESGILIKFPDREPAEALLKLALDRRVEIKSYDFNHGSLEDLFIKIVSER